MALAIRAWSRHLGFYPGFGTIQMSEFNECPHLPTLSLSPASLLTIRTQEIGRSFFENYTRLLGEIVFTLGTITGDDRKTIKSFRRTLESHEANTVLSILWRESPYITDDELAYDGHAKLFGENPLTCY